MTSNSDNKNKKFEFFKLTKQEISANVEKYDKVAVPTSVFKTIPIDEEKLKEKPIIFQRRLNSLDSTILEDNAYKTLDNQELKLEKRIESCEKSIKALEEEIIVAETVKNIPMRESLLEQKEMLLKTLNNLKAQYVQQSAETRLTTIIADILRIPSKIKKELSKQIKIRLRHSKWLRNCSPLMKIIIARETIEKLNKINKSVDQLVSMKVPFGEQEAKYQTLINHLAQANSLHTQIRKELKGK